MSLMNLATPTAADTCDENLGGQGARHWLFSFDATTTQRQAVAFLHLSRTMKTSTVIFTLAAAIAIPFASAQSLAPSAADSSFDSLVPTVRDARCSAYPLCEAEDLADDCCPTIENVFLDCCELDVVPPPAPVSTTAGPPTEPSLVEILTGDDRFTSLVDAVVLTELLPALEVDGPLTIFAPTNDAFANVDTSGLTLEQVESILLYHVAEGEVPLEDGLAVPTLNGNEVLLSVAFDETKVNEANIDETIISSNGIIYVVDAVLIPAAPAPTPGAATPPPAPVDDPSMMPSTETDIIDTTVPTGVPTGADTSVPVESPTTAPSSAPSSTPDGTILPTSGTPATTVTLTPKNYNGCMKIDGDGEEDDDLILATCDASDPKQQFTFVGEKIQLAMDSSLCLQGGRNVMPDDGKYIRVYPCRDDETLQKFSWDAPDGALTLMDYPDFAVVFRGTSANVNSDPIILGDLNNSDVLERKDWTILN